MRSARRDLSIDGADADGSAKFRDKIAPKVSGRNNLGFFPLGFQSTVADFKGSKALATAQAWRYSTPALSSTSNNAQPIPESLPFTASLRLNEPEESGRLSRSASCTLAVAKSPSAGGGSSAGTWRPASPPIEMPNRPSNEARSLSRSFSPTIEYRPVIRSDSMDTGGASNTPPSTLKDAAGSGFKDQDSNCVPLFRR